MLENITHLFTIFSARNLVKTLSILSAYLRIINFMLKTHKGLSSTFCLNCGKNSL
jgi:hypothetical protein